ncbi:CRISPR-associated protein Cas4 [Fervidibacillus halotolerans]|uniref:CRISPR-associated exonuclease Cas4 n=1 Tax=Fervidibacillus halotolerans TaxID=2980027 RepID=A0A9E8RZU5_9BACI|nr:CRISPR-associated protein Cas4 [Fervidibacillus halotolerans]WAA11987.1 CRISPR-associated protein Cas4 [Fervidibacillus halotolerans]
MGKGDVYITGTDIWYYMICPREVWLMIHEIAPNQEDDNIEIGRFIHEYRYERQKKELDLENVKIDRIKQKGETLIIQEIKKSSKFIESAKFQLLFYLYQLKKMGIDAKGELTFPEERKKETVELTDESIEKLEKIINDIYRIANLEVPPEPKKIKYCRNCAYKEYCWAEG